MHNDCNLVTQSVSDVACYRRASVMSMITESKKKEKKSKSIQNSVKVFKKVFNLKFDNDFTSRTNYYYCTLIYI